MMTPIEVQIRVAVAVLVACLLTWGGYSLYQKGYNSCQTKWDADKAQRKVEADQQAASSLVKELEQDRINLEKEKKYEQVKKDRDIALGALRDYRLCPVEVMSGSENLRVAGSGKDAVPRQAEGSVLTNDTSALAASFTFSNAIKDRDQCNALIDWVKSQGM